MVPDDQTSEICVETKDILGPRFADQEPLKVGVKLAVLQKGMIGGESRLCSPAKVKLTPEEVRSKKR